MNGASDDFTRRLIQKLIDFGEIAAGEQALAHLLDDIRGKVGVDKHGTIDKLIKRINNINNVDLSAKTVRATRRFIYIPPNRITLILFVGMSLILIALAILIVLLIIRPDPVPVVQGNPTATNTDQPPLTPTETPTPTPIPFPTETPISPNDLVAATFTARAALTASAVAAFTKTPPPTFTASATLTETPHTAKTVEEIVRQTDIAGTAFALASQTKTATPAFTATYPPTPTLPPAIGLNQPIPAGTSNSVWTPQSRDFDGVSMVYVPAGCFLMGTTDEQVASLVRQHNMASFENEKPVHEVCITIPFWLDKHEISNGQFVGRGGQAGRASNWASADLPRESITWTEAEAYCQQRGARLPTEAEWEYAARGPQSLTYPWGNDFVAENVTYSGNAGSQTAPTDSRAIGASWVGALNLSGNVWEWVADWYADNHYASGPKNDPTGPTSGYYRVIRGGSWGGIGSFVRGAIRVGKEIDVASEVLGFRCARAE